MTHNYYKPNTYLTNTNYTLNLTQHTQHTRWDTKNCCGEFETSGKDQQRSIRTARKQLLVGAFGPPTFSFHRI